MILDGNRTRSIPDIDLMVGQKLQPHPIGPLQSRQTFCSWRFRRAILARRRSASCITP
jgi:hypothetical protein